MNGLSLSEKMREISRDVITSPLTDVEQDIQYIQKHGRQKWRALWVLRENSSYILMLDYAEEIQYSDFLAHLHTHYQALIQFIQQGYNTCYLITISNPQKPDGNLRQMDAKDAIAFVNQLLLNLPAIPVN